MDRQHHRCKPLCQRKVFKSFSTTESRLLHTVCFFSMESLLKSFETIKTSKKIIQHVQLYQIDPNRKNITYSPVTLYHKTSNPRHSLPPTQPERLVFQQSAVGRRPGLAFQKNLGDLHAGELSWKFLMNIFLASSFRIGGESRLVTYVTMWLKTLKNISYNILELLF